MKRVRLHSLANRLATLPGIRRYFGPPAPPENPGVTFAGDFPDWESALAAARGYDAPAILEKAVNAMRLVRDGKAACERDTVAFDRKQRSFPLLSWLLYAAGREEGRLRVMDFGGALGSSYHQHNDLLSHLTECRWGVVEQPHFAAAGKAEFETAELLFFDDWQACLSALRPNFLLLSSVLQYLHDPLPLLGTLLDQGIAYVCIDRTMAWELPDRIVVQHVPPTIYEASYAARLLCAQRLEAQCRQSGYEIVDTYDPCPGSAFGPPECRRPYLGWLLRKDSPA